MVYNGVPERLEQKAEVALLIRKKLTSIIKNLHFGEWKDWYLTMLLTKHGYLTICGVYVPHIVKNEALYNGRMISGAFDWSGSH